jgi:hypothetical protein
MTNSEFAEDSNGNLVEYCYEFDGDCCDTLTFLQDPSGTECAGIGATVWDSALVLTKYLETQFHLRHSPTTHIADCSNAAQQEDFIMNRDVRILPGAGWRPEKWMRILELGSGVGICGLVLNSLLQLRTSTDRRHRLVLTDKPIALPLLQRNVDHYFKQIGKICLPSDITVCPLDWLDAQQHQQNREKFDLILASDCVHWPELFQPLVDTLAAHSLADTEILLAYERRDFDKEAEFFRCLGEKFCFYAVSSLRNQMHPQWQSPEDIYVFRARLRRQGE